MRIGTAQVPSVQRSANRSRCVCFVGEKRQMNPRHYRNGEQTCFLVNTQRQKVWDFGQPIIVALAAPQESGAATLLKGMPCTLPTHLCFTVNPGPDVPKRCPSVPRVFCHG